MSNADHDYYTFRADDERARAEASSDPQIARIHQELAAKYDELIALAAEKPLAA